MTKNRYEGRYFYATTTSFGTYNSFIIKDAHPLMKAPPDEVIAWYKEITEEEYNEIALDISKRAC